MIWENPRKSLPSDYKTVAVLTEDKRIIPAYCVDQTWYDNDHNAIDIDNIHNWANLPRPYWNMIDFSSVKPKEMET